jgi:hypothetical protein
VPGRVDATSVSRPLPVAVPMKNRTSPTKNLTNLKNPTTKMHLKRNLEKKISCFRTLKKLNYLKIQWQLSEQTRLLNKER